MLPFTAMTLTRAVKQLEATDLFYVAKDGVNKFIESKYDRYELFEKAKVYLSTPVRRAGYIDKTQITENMVFAGETALSERTMLNPSRVVTYAISEKSYDKTLMMEELIDPDKQVRLELWAYNPKQFSEDSNADDFSVILSFGDTNDERIEEAGYEHLNKSTGNAQFYRFTTPKSNEYPYMIEIFSRNPDFILLEEDATVHRHIFLFYVNYKRGGRLYLFRPLCLSLK